jgi:biofilm PGA synthesis protein PgaA
MSARSTTRGTYSTPTNAAEFLQRRGATALAVLTLASWFVPFHALSQTATRDQLLAQARGQRDTGHRVEALGACEALLQRWPVDRDALTLRVQLLSELGAAQRALELARQLPAPLPTKQMIRLEADASAQQTRRAQAMSADARRPYAEADRAVALENAAAQQYEQLNSSPSATITADRLIALSDAGLNELVVREYDALRARNGVLLPYAVSAVADALLRQHQPERAIPLYERALRDDPGPYSQEHVDLRISLAYAYLEAGRYRDATLLIDRVVNTEPSWLPGRGTPIPQGNAHKVDAAITAARMRKEAGLYREAWERLQALRTEGPANASIWLALAAVERARGWPRRSEDTLMGAAGLDPDNTAIRLDAIEDWRELYDYSRVEPALRELEAVISRDPGVQQTRDSWDRQRGWQFDVETTRGRGGSANFGDADHETQATLQSPLLADHWRLYGIARLASADLPEGHAERDRLGLGLRGYARGLEAYVQVLPSLDSQSPRTALEAGLRWSPTDHWTYALDWSNTGDQDVPLRAHYYGITANALSAAVQWRASEQSTIKLNATQDRFSDGNQRYGWDAAWMQRTYTSPWLTFDAGLDVGTTRDSRTDVPYYSPSCATSAAITGRLDNMLYQRYEQTWRQRVDLSLGSYDECRYGDGWTASARYSQSYEPRSGLAVSMGIGWSSQPYDGKRDNRVTLDLAIHWGE